MMNLRTRQTLIVLGDRILLLTLDRWRRQFSFDQTGPVLDGPTDSEKLIRLTETALPDKLGGGGADLILGTPWTRSELISLPGSSLSRKDETSLAESCAERMRGEFSAPLGPLLVRSARLPGKLLVVAVSETNCQRLVESLGRRNIPVRSLQPLFAWLSIHPQTRPEQHDGWSVLHEPGALSVCHYTAGKLDSYRTHPLDHHSADLPDMVRRQVAATGWPEGDVELLSLGFSPDTMPKAWKSNALPRSPKKIKQ